MSDKNIFHERSKFIEDLEVAFSQALNAGDYKAAIHAKHLIGKMHGFLDHKRKGISLFELTQSELESLISEAENICEIEHVKLDR